MNPTLTYILDVLIRFKAETCTNPRKWIITMVVRGIILYLIPVQAIIDKFPMDRNETLSAVLYDFLVPVPIALFLLWYYGTSILMFLAVVYYRKPSPNESEFAEIDKFLSWRETRMKNMPYSEAQQLMAETSILNNLDRSNPEAKKQLEYMNSQMRHMSYTDSLEFLRGKR